jgi:hypothetical protein
MRLHTRLRKSRKARSAVVVRKTTFIDARPTADHQAQASDFCGRAKLDLLQARLIESATNVHPRRPFSESRRAKAIVDLNSRARAECARTTRAPRSGSSWLIHGRVAPRELSLTAISVTWAGALPGNLLAGQHPDRKRGRSRQGA